jgi:hypothetical protein
LLCYDASWQDESLFRNTQICLPDIPSALFAYGVVWFGSIAKFWSSLFEHNHYCKAQMSMLLQVVQGASGGQDSIVV